MCPREAVSPPDDSLRQSASKCVWFQVHTFVPSSLVLATRAPLNSRRAWATHAWPRRPQG